MEINKYLLQPDVRGVIDFEQQDKIYLSIQIGNGQIGGSKISLDGKQLAKGNLSQPTLIGDSVVLKGKEIKIETNVLDVNNFTNMCVITTTFLNQENKVLFTKIDNGEAPENGVASFVGTYKLLIWLLLFFIFNPLNIASVKAQTVSDELTFQSLETPSSPGLILLDQAPASIERPTTPQGFGINVLGLFQGSGGAMEFAPFWLVNHPHLTAEEMYKNQIPILYNFSVSVATVKTDSSGFLAGGIRTRLFQSYNKITTIKLDSVKNEMEQALADLNLDTPDFRKLEILQQYYSELITKPVFSIDIAGALGGGSVTNSFKTIDLNRWAAWLSFNWRPKGNDLYATALIRYMYNDQFKDYPGKANLLDAGLRLNYDVAKFCMSLEYLQRFDLTNNNGSDYRIAVVGSYAFSENIYITATIGKNYGNVNNLIALAGINFGISKTKIKAF